MRKIGCWLALLLFLFGQPARAQSRLFVSGDVFADAQRFSGDSSSTLDATTVGGGANVGVLVNDRWDVRAELAAGGTTSVTQPLIRSVASFQSRTRTRITATSMLVGFHPLSRSRVHLAVLGGLTFLHVRTQLDSIPTGLVVRARTEVDNVAAPTVGAELPILLFPHVSVVPEFRAHAFSLRERAGGFVIRPGVGIRWSK